MGFKFTTQDVHRLREEQEISLFEAKLRLVRKEAEERLKVANGWDDVRDVLLDLLPYIHLI